MLNDVVWEELEGHLHVLVSIERCFKINVFYISPIKFGSLLGPKQSHPHR